MTSESEARHKPSGRDNQLVLTHGKSQCQLRDDRRAYVLGGLPLDGDSHPLLTGDGADMYHGPCAFTSTFDISTRLPTRDAHPPACGDLHQHRSKQMTETTRHQERLWPRGPSQLEQDEVPDRMRKSLDTLLPPRKLITGASAGKGLSSQYVRLSARGDSTRLMSDDAPLHRDSDPFTSAGRLRSRPAAQHVQTSKLQVIIHEDIGIQAGPWTLRGTPGPMAPTTQERVGLITGRVMVQTCFVGRRDFLQHICSFKCVILTILNKLCFFTLDHI